MIIAIELSSEIEIGKTIPIKSEGIDSSIFILRGKSELKRRYLIGFKGTKYRVTLNENRFIDYIETDDPNFETQKARKQVLSAGNFGSLVMKIISSIKKDGQNILDLNLTGAQRSPLIVL